MVLLDGDGITGEGVKATKELMSSPAVLKAFINYGVDHYPAEKYDLILWDHGGGPVGGFGADDHYGVIEDGEEEGEGESVMSFTGLITALSDNKVVDRDGDGVRDSRFDFIDFDACLMNSVELAFAMADYTDYYIASAETEPGYGQYYGPANGMYKGWLDELGDPGKDAIYNSEGGTYQLGKVIVDDFYTFYEVDNNSDGYSQKGTLAVIDTQKMIAPETGFISALLELSGILKAQAAEADPKDGIRFYDEFKSFYSAINYGGSDLYDLGAIAAFLAVVNIEISPQDLAGGDFHNENEYLEVSKKITRLLKLQDTDPDAAFMYARGTKGVKTAERYYRKTDGGLDFGSLKSYGLSLFFPGTFNSSDSVLYYTAIDPVIATMAENDPRAVFLRDYEETLGYYSMILTSGRYIDGQINDFWGYSVPKESLNPDVILADWRAESWGIWNSFLYKYVEKTRKSADEVDNWLRVIITQQLEEAVEATKVTAAKVNHKEGEGYRLTINDAKKRIINTVKRNIVAELPILQNWIKNLNEQDRRMVEKENLSVGSVEGELTGFPEGASNEELIRWYNETGAVWDVGALEKKWYAINDAGGALHVAAIDLNDEDGLYVPALYGTSEDGADKNRLVYLHFDPVADGSGSRPLVSLWFVGTDSGLVQIMPKDLVESITVTPILYIKPFIGDNYYGPISTAFTISAENAGSISLDYMDIDDITDIADIDSDGRKLNSTVTIVDFYNFEINVTESIKKLEDAELTDIELARVKPALYTGEERIPQVAYLGEVLQEGVDYTWEKVSVVEGEGEDETFITPEFIEPGDYRINLTGKGRFIGMAASVIFTIVRDEEAAQALIDQAKAELDSAQAAMQKAITANSKDSLDAAYIRLVNAQNALSEAQELLRAMQDILSKEEQQKLEEKIADLEQQIEELNAELAEASIVDISNYEVTMETSFEYTSEPIEPSVNVSGVNAENYEVSYENNTEVGTATVTITATGEGYKGTITKKFEIKPVSYERIYGSNRYGTAMAAADKLLELRGAEKFSAIVLANADKEPDALGGAALAGKMKAPILMIKADASNKGSKDTLAYIKEKLESGGKIFILGSEEAVSAPTETTLKRAGYDVKRLGGKNRYATNLRIVDELNPAHGSDVYIATGKGFADALSVSAVSAKKRAPIILVNMSLTKEALDTIAEIQPANIYIIGGSKAVPETVEKQLKDYPSVKRLAGDTRYTTSIEVAKALISSDAKTAVIATGLNFPDGLAAGPLAAELNAPLLLAAEKKTDSAKDYAKQNGITKYYVMGGVSAVSDEVAEKIVK